MEMNGNDEVRQDNVLAVYGINLHVECRSLNASSDLASIQQHIEQHPVSLAKVDEIDGCLPLHALLYTRKSCPIILILAMEKYPAALQHHDNKGRLPLHIEIIKRSRSVIINRCIRLHSESLAQVDERGYLPLH